MQTPPRQTPPRKCSRPKAEPGHAAGDARSAARDAPRGASSREVTLRTAVRGEVAGSLNTVAPTREWTHAPHPHLSGSIGSTRLDVFAFGLTPPALRAHAHRGNFEFERNPEQARRHYEVGTTIGGASLGEGFDGVLAWDLTDPRPFARCMHGAGLGAWRLGDVRVAKASFTKLRWLNPSDNQSARFNLAAVEDGRPRDGLEGDS